LAGETEVSGEKLSQCHFVHQKSHMNGVGLNPDRRCEMLAIINTDMHPRPELIYIKKERFSVLGAF
jgi:hypothetical protein